jgi:hypothetical protein
MGRGELERLSRREMIEPVLRAPPPRSATGLRRPSQRGQDDQERVIILEIAGAPSQALVMTRRSWVITTA